MNPEQFRQWRLRMGGLTLAQTATTLKISFSSARDYGDGRRKIPNYIELLCDMVEQQKITQGYDMNKPTKLKSASQLAPLMASAYINARSKKNPAMAVTLNRAQVEEEMQQVIATIEAHGFTINAANNKKTG